MARIHPTAIVDPSAVLADDVEIGPFCIVEGEVTIGAGTLLRQNVIVRRYTTLGVGNMVDAFTVLGGEPQDLKFDPKTVSYLRIGDSNVFREGVTISRATTPGGATVVGSKTYWMQGAHAGHDSLVQDECILVNGSVLAGHTILGRKSILSGHVGLHQFCWVGEMCMSQGNSITTQHIPPYCLFAGVSDVVSLNVVGLRRSAELNDEDRRQIKEAFRLLYLSRLTPRQALEQMDQCTDWRPAAGKFRDFVRRVLEAKKPYNRGLGRLRCRTIVSAE